MQSLSLIVVGVGLGVGVASTVHQDELAGRALAGYDEMVGGAAALGPLVEPAPPVDPAVLRFAWASTCEIAVAGVAHGSVGDIRQAFQVAHDQAALFEAGVVPSDVSAILGEAYTVVVLRERGATNDGAPMSAGLGRRIGDACRAWSARIEAAG